LRLEITSNYNNSITTKASRDAKLK
jgi:hypothetical protein